MIETLSDKNNSFLSRREIICDFKGLAGKLEKIQAIEMITKEFKLEKKLVIPIMLKNHTGMPKITGTFYVYDDEKLAKEHVNPTIFTRLEKSKADLEKKKTEKAAEEPTKTEASELWEKSLNKIHVKDKSKIKKEIFYTALYHSLIVPNLYVDVEIKTCNSATLFGEIA